MKFNVNNIIANSQMNFKEFLAASIGISLGLFFLIMLNTKDQKTLSQAQFISQPQVLAESDPNLSSQETDKIKILFTGDLMMDRYIRTLAEKNSYNFILEPLRDTFFKYDLVVSNLEGPITDKASISQYSQIGEPKNFIFTMNPQVATALYDNNIRLVNIGNNHILNFGDDGLAQTKKYLAGAGVNYFGYTSSQNVDLAYYIFDQNDFKIVFLNYNQFIDKAKEQTLEDLARIKEKNFADYIVLYTHWGNEYQKQASESIQKLAHEFIDAGVDLIIGTHPHVVEQNEEYAGKQIYYSLGNFVFDQYFLPETEKGLMVELSLDPETKQAHFETLPVIMTDSGQSIFAEN